MDRRTPDDPLIIVGHSMGGIILYDLFTSYVPTLMNDLVVDHYVTVGSQVGFMQEMDHFPANKGVNRGTAGSARVREQLDQRVRQDRSAVVSGGAGVWRRWHCRHGLLLGHRAAVGAPRHTSCARVFTSAWANGCAVNDPGVPTRRAPDTGNGGLHVLIVGVGHYPVLANPPVGFPPELNQIEGELPAVTASALRLAQWFENNYEGERPLASIRMLANSPDMDELYYEAGGQRLLLESPTLGNIRTAARAWRDGCHERAEHAGMFFFVGHGYQEGDTLGLAADFGEDPEDPLRHAVALDSFVQRMRLCKAQLQGFFFDCCREHMDVLTAYRNDDRDPGDALLGVMGTKYQPDQPVIFSTMPERQAFVKRDGETLFVQSFIRNAERCRECSAQKRTLGFSVQPDAQCDQDVDGRRGPSRRAAAVPERPAQHRGRSHLRLLSGHAQREVRDSLSAGQGHSSGEAQVEEHGTPACRNAATKAAA